MSTRCPRNDADCPHPQNDSLGEIEFTPRHDMVDWLSPSQLADTGLKAVIAGTFGSYADKREVEVAVSPLKGAEIIDYSENKDGSKNDELWFDYIADLGDGFDPTYAMACLLAKESLDVKGVKEPLPHGAFVVLGGDQVYPTAKRDAYQNQFIGPYRAALPWRPKDAARQIYAIPGNHDWYDGLNSFLRIFCQARDADGKRARWIGAWKAPQRRSYFAIKLPGNWWVWGIDGQLESDMDKPQLEYFEDLSDDICAKRESGENTQEQKIILVTPEPNWVYCGEDGSSKTCSLVNPIAFDTLAHFEKRYVRGKDLRLAAVVSGDLHHYVHYISDDGTKHRITAGGGGAYLLATHQMPERITVREGAREKTIAEEKKTPYALGKTSLYPRAKTSKWLSLGITLIAVRNWTLGLLFGAIYLLFAWGLQTASRANDMVEPSLLDHFATAGDWSTRWHFFWRAFSFSPGSILFAIVLVAALWGFTYSQRKLSPKILSWIGAVHGALHVAVAVGLMCLITRMLASQKYRLGVAAFLGIAIAGAFAVFLFAPRRMRSRMNVVGAIVLIALLAGLAYGISRFATAHLPIVPTPVAHLGGDASKEAIDLADAKQGWFSPLFVVPMLVLGWYLSTTIFGTYMWLTSTFTGGHTGEVFSSMAIEGYKHFLRFHVQADGSLHVYPIGVRKVPNKWRFNDKRNCGEPFFEPDGAKIEPEIIDGPFIVK